MAHPPHACPICAALLLSDALWTHVDWHAKTDTLNGWTGEAAVRVIRDNAAAVAALAVDEDDAPTLQLPPIGETVRRRPPVPNVRELKGPELLRALADELDRDGLSVDDL